MCTRCDREPCVCTNLLDILGQDVGNNILSLLSSQEMAGLLGASRTTRAIARREIEPRLHNGRWDLLSLFAVDGPLYDLYCRSVKALPQSIHLYSHPFDAEAPYEADRAGQFLAHVAVAIRNKCDRLCFRKYRKSLSDAQYGIVVVTTLVLKDGKRILLVALNGGAKECRAIYEEFCKTSNFHLALGLHEVHVVHNSDPPHASLATFFEKSVVNSEKAYSDWLRNSKVNNGQDWHGEQKILQYVEDVFGFDMKKFILCLGISHLDGPCEDETNRAQHCGRFLEALRVLDLTFLGQGALFVVGFWFSGGPKNKAIYDLTLENFNA